MITQKAILNESKNYLVTDKKITSSGLILTDKKRLLMCYSAKSNMLDIPKGKVEIGETFEEACVREVYEETGLDVSRYDLTSHGTKPYTASKNIALYSLVTHTDSLPPLGLMKPNAHFHTLFGTSNNEVAGYEYVSFNNLQGLVSRRMVNPALVAFLKESFVDVERTKKQTIDKFSWYQYKN
ncbi:NUDIX domain-containing protein [Bacillus bombysepticus]|uniref:NUDIX domain-containing protein n=1 Tax=Bacillus bombysepticus TaxID=658666 RepID=UPI003015A14E